jgi:hypothetical protein
MFSRLYPPVWLAAFAKMFPLLGVQPIAPTSIGTLIRYWHADFAYTDLANTTLAGVSDAITSFKDLTGGSKHMIQTTAGARGYIDLIGGKKYAHWDSTDDYAFETSQAIPNGAEMFIIAQAQTRTFPGPINDVDPLLTGGLAGSAIGLEFYNGFGTRNELRFYSEFCNTPYVNGSAYVYPAVITPGQLYMVSAVSAGTATSNLGYYLNHFELSTAYGRDPIRTVFVTSSAVTSAQRAGLYAWGALEA